MTPPKAPPKPPPEIKEVFSCQISDKIASVRLRPNDRNSIGVASQENVLIVSPEGVRETMQCVKNQKSFFDVSWDSQGVLLSSVSTEGVLYIWDTREKTSPKGVRGPSSCQISVQFNPANDQQLATTGMDEYVYVWDLRNLEKPRRIRGAPEPICSAFYQANGSKIACGSILGNVGVFNVVDGSLQSQLHIGEDSAIFDIKIAPKSEYILVASQNGIVGLCSIKERQGRYIKKYVGHICDGLLSRCSFLGASYVMSTSSDGRVVVWYLNSHKIIAQELQCYTRSDSGDRCVMGLDEVIAKGYFVTGCMDGTVKAWESTNI